MGLIPIKQDVVIERFKNTHGDKYDYSVVEYKKMNIKVKVICKEHGIFEVTPIQHTKKINMCPKCRNNFKSTIKKRGTVLTKEEIIKKFNSVHGDKYDYSNINYINEKTPIIVQCKVEGHGEFSIKPNTHMYVGNACPKCKVRNKVKLDKQRRKEIKFIKKIQNTHKGYDYSLMVYNNSSTPIKIICKEHGVFEQTPSVHLTQHGICPKCTLMKKQKKFLIEAKERFKSRYSYDKFEYKGSIIPSIMTCSIHGDFEQTPSLHLIGKEPCPKCRGLYGETTEEFVAKAKKIHGDDYDYSLVKYINRLTYVEILCKQHGLFRITPEKHIHCKTGCPECNKDRKISKMEIEWLNSLLIPIRSYKVNNFIADGFNPTTNTLYEFLGDYWHGNLNRYKSDEVNITNKRTFGELNKRTFKRFDELKEMGYKIIYIWESGFLNGKESQIY